MPLRDFLKFLSVFLLAAYSMLFTVVWVNAYTYGYELTITINDYGEAFPEGLLIFGFLWPVVSVGLYFIAVDEGWVGSGDTVEGPA